MSMTMMMTNILPHDVVMDILSRLPVKSLLRFRCVCKPWKIFFNDPSFIKMHLNHSINNYEHVMLGNSCLYFNVDSNESSLADDDKVVMFDYPFETPGKVVKFDYPVYTPGEVVKFDYPFDTPGSRFKILGSCNGLLLITPYEDIYCIWNPSTKEFKKLPDTPIKFPKNNKDIYCISIEYGFGYDKIIEDYKVVKIVTFENYWSEVKVYTLGSDSWRRIQHIPKTLASTQRESGKLVNGVLHWLVKKLIYYDDDEEKPVEDEVSYIILSLNIENEKYGEIQQPDFTDTKFHMNVEVLGGCLCITRNFYNVGSEIWVMKDYGVKESWTKLFTVKQPSIFLSFWYVTPVKFTKNGELLFLKDNYSPVMYDPKCGSAKTLYIDGLQEWLEACTYVESLISLNSGTFVGQEQAAWERTLKNRNRKDKEEEQKEMNNYLQN